MWRSWSIRPLSLLAVAAIECGIIAAVATLLTLSTQRNGFVKVNDPEADSEGTNSALWNQGLLWTVLPSVLLTLFRLYHESVVTSVVNEAPYAELYRPGGTSVKKSLVLDYRTIPAWKAWAVAYSNGHWPHATSMLLGWTISLFVVPFSARLMAPAPTPFDTRVDGSTVTAFQSTAINASVDYRPILDAVSAVRIFAGSPPPWTDGVYAFPTSEIAGEANAGQVLSVAYEVDAISAHLQCVEIPQSTYTSQRNGDSVQFSASDRGCDISIDGSVLGSSQEYLKISPIDDCTDSSGFSRLVMYAGVYDPDSSISLSQFSLISCIPIYEQTHGVLNVSRSLTTNNPLLAFSPSTTINPTTIRTAAFTQFESDLNSVSDINAASPSFTSTFGGIVLALSRKISSTNDSNAHLLPATLVTALSTVFTTSFAFTVSTIAFVPSPESSPTTATLTTTTTRLHIVPWIAYTFFAIFALLLAETLVLYLYLRAHPTHVREEPRGLMSHAEMVVESESLARVVAQARADHRYENGKVVGYLEGCADLGETRCWVTKGEAGREVVVMEDMVPKRKRKGEGWFRRMVGSKEKGRVDT